MGSTQTHDATGPRSPARSLASPSRSREVPASPSAVALRAAGNPSTAGLWRGLPLILLTLGWILAAAMPAQASPETGPAWARGDAEEAPEPGPIRRAADAPPWPKDFEVGLQAARAFAHHFGLVEEDSVLQRINRIAYEVASQSGRNDILFTFHILDTPEPNALALPGGFIFVTRGMTELELPDDAMANLLGHEMAHVTEAHFNRAGRLNSALSLLQTAVMVAALVAIPAGNSGGIDYDPETGDYRTSLSGKEAAVQGSNIFGSVFRELLQRGYGRGLEMEADEVGRRFAGRAGYPVNGCVHLMEELHRRIFEDQEFGYWRTHPYFTDRVAKARAAVNAGGTTPGPQEVRAYREKTARRLFELAQSIEDEPTALFVYRDALRAGPQGEPSLKVEHKLLQLRAERLRKQKPVLRAYGPLLADYDSLVTRLKGASPASEILDGLRTERADLDRERNEIRVPIQEILERERAGTVFLELFLANFPEDTLAPRVRLRLAEQYRLADRPDEAALVLAEPASGSDAIWNAWRPRSEEELRRILPLTRELTTNQKLLDAPPSDSVRTWAGARLRAQAAGLDSLELGSGFLEEYPDSPVSGDVKARVEELAMKRYYAARLRESLRDFQFALDGYNGLVLLAPDTEAARLSREGVARIQSLAGH